MAVHVTFKGYAATLERGKWRMERQSPALKGLQRATDLFLGRDMLPGYVSQPMHDYLTAKHIAELFGGQLEDDTPPPQEAIEGAVH